MPRWKERVSASKVLGDAALLCLLAGFEKTSLTGAGIYATIASHLLFVVHRNGDCCGSHLLSINSTVYFCFFQSTDLLRFYFFLKFCTVSEV